VRAEREQQGRQQSTSRRATASQHASASCASASASTSASANASAASASGQPGESQVYRPLEGERKAERVERRSGERVRACKRTWDKREWAEQAEVEQAEVGQRHATAHHEHARKNTATRPNYERTRKNARNAPTPDHLRAPTRAAQGLSAPHPGAKAESPHPGRRLSHTVLSALVTRPTCALSLPTSPEGEVGKAPRWTESLEATWLGKN